MSESETSSLTTPVLVPWTSSEALATTTLSEFIELLLFYILMTILQDDNFLYFKILMTKLQYTID